MPKPYNHPVRTAESVAVLDLISGGRVDVGTGRSATRAELEGFGIDPHQTRAMWREAIEHVGRLLDQRRARVRRRLLADARGAGSCPSRCRSRTRRCGARPAVTRATARSARLGPRACARSRSGVPPEEVKRQVDIYREAVDGCDRRRSAPRPRRGRHLHHGAVRHDRDRAWATARESFEWYPKAGARQIATLAELMAEQQARPGQLRLRRRPEEDRRRGACSTCSPSSTSSTPARASSARPPTASRRAGATRPPASTSCSASSTPTRSRTTPSCAPSSSWAPTSSPTSLPDRARPNVGYLGALGEREEGPRDRTLNVRADAVRRVGAGDVGVRHAREHEPLPARALEGRGWRRGFQARGDLPVLARRERALSADRPLEGLLVGGLWMLASTVGASDSPTGAPKDRADTGHGSPVRHEPVHAP